MLAAHCLALAIYYEARNQPIDGQLAVAQVVMNRVESNRYPDDVCGVVWQDKQFSFTHDGLPERPKHHSWGDIKDMAEMVLSGASHEFSELSATHYHADYVQPYWANSMDRFGKIGDHIFYIEN